MDSILFFEKYINFSILESVNLNLASIFLACILTYLISTSFHRLILQFFTISVQVSGTYGDSVGCSSGPNDRVYHGIMRWLGDNVTTFQIRKITGATEKAPEEKSDEKSPLEKPSTNNPDSNNNPTKPAPEDDDDDGCACSWNNQSGAGCIYKLRPAPGYGSHFFQYKGNLIFLERHAMDPKCILNMTSQEMLTLTVPRWNFSILQEILDLAKPKKSNSNKQLVIYKAVEDYWTQLGGRKKKRPLDTIFLSGEVITSLLNDLRTFLTLEDWYVQRGIPYRRGYLLYGPPGCGKTSVIKAIAGTIGYDICVFSLSQKMTDDSLCELLNSAPEKSLILLEDIDSAFKSREDSDASARETNLAFEGCSQSSLTFRGLLNALDGVASSEDGQIIFMTTNYPEKLDPALVRPGRVDYKVHIDYPDDLQLERMFQMFYPEAEQTLSKTFVKTVRAQDDLKLSMAMAQGLFLMYKDSPQDAVKNVKEHFKKQFSNVNVNKPSCGLYM